MINLLENSILHLNHSKPCFWPYFGQKWPKMVKMPIFCFQISIMIGAYLYVFWDEKCIGKYYFAFKSPETMFLAILSKNGQNGQSGHFFVFRYLS